MRAARSDRRLRRWRGWLALAWLGLAPQTFAQSLPNRLLRYAAIVDGSGEASLRWPTDVAASSQDEVAVADAWRGRLVVFRRIGAGWASAHEVVLPRPPVAVVHFGGEYLVALRGVEALHAVRMTADGATTREIPLPERMLPGRLAAAGTDLLLWDSRGGRVVRLREGRIVGQVAVERTVTALASDGLGGFWVGVGERGEVVRYDADGRRNAAWAVPPDGVVRAWPAGIAGEPGGRLFVLDRHAHRVVVFDSAGRQIGLGGARGHEPGQLFYPGGVVRLPDGRLLIGDGGNGRAQLFDVVGEGSK